MFTKPFDKYACEGDSITCRVEGFIVTATIVKDNHHGIDDDDSHNPDQGVTGCNDEQQAELLAARKAWEKDEWWYCGVRLTVSTLTDILLVTNAASLWGIECNYPGSDNSYLLEVANELLPEALEAAHKVMEQAIASYKRNRNASPSLILNLNTVPPR